MSLIITVEGLDSTGKTTLIEQLVKDFPGLKVIPSIGNKHDVLEIRRQALDWPNYDRQDYVSAQVHIADRCRLISEMVYNPVLKTRGLAISASEFLDVTRRWLEFPQLIVYCFRSKDRLLKTLHNEEQLSGVEEHLDELSLQYSKMMSTLEFLINLYDNGSKIIVYSFDHERKEMKYPSVRNAVIEYLHLVEGMIR